MDVHGALIQTDGGKPRGPLISGLEIVQLADRVSRPKNQFVADNDLNPLCATGVARDAARRVFVGALRGCVARFVLV